MHLRLFKWTLAVVGLLALAPAPARASGFGAGLLVQTTPDSAALSLAGEIGDGLTLAGAFTPMIGATDLMYAHLDVTFDLGQGFETGAGPVEFYFGAGGRVQAIDRDAIGARVPVGMKYHIHETPVEFFVDVAPVFDVYLNTPGFDYQILFQGGLGIRYYFAGSKTGKKN